MIRNVTEELFLSFYDSSEISGTKVVNRQKEIKPHHKIKSWRDSSLHSESKMFV